MAVRPIGYLRMIDEGKPDQKILAVPSGEPEYGTVTGFKQISPHILRKIQYFLKRTSCSRESIHRAKVGATPIRQNR